MGEVVELKPKEAHDPHNSGPALCLGCGHRWTAVAPVGVTEMECPECRTMRGVWAALNFGPDDSEIFRCACGGLVYVVHRTIGVICVRCGMDHQF